MISAPKLLAATITAAVLLAPCAAQTLTIDFSKAYVDRSATGQNRVKLGGIGVVGAESFYSATFELDPAYNLRLTGALLQTLTTPEALQHALRGTTWQGTYTCASKTFPTTFSVLTSSEGFVSGRVVHSSPPNDVDRWDGYVSGLVVTEYNISGTWIAADLLTPSQLSSLTQSTPNRLRLRLKRVGATAFVNGNDGSTWSSNREYRLIRTGSQLNGETGVPAESFGSSSGLSSSCSLEFALK